MYKLNIRKYHIGLMVILLPNLLILDFFNCRLIKSLYEHKSHIYIDSKLAPEQLLKQLFIKSSLWCILGATRGLSQLIYLAVFVLIRMHLKEGGLLGGFTCSIPALL